MTYNSSGDTAYLTVVPDVLAAVPSRPATSSTGCATTCCPRAEDGTSLEVHVGGVTAGYDDFAEVIVGKLPLFVGVVIALGCLLLLLAFRSIGIPLKAAAMNVAAVASAFGVVVAIFQWGWGSELLGLGSAGPIEPFLPVIMVSVLFGLSMDYQVFLVSRMYEEWLETGDNRRAVRVGLAETSRVINSAAVIMISVFLAFVLSGDRVIAMFGIALAAAVALDAFVLRTLLVPALMHLLGGANWWLPRWLDRRLPRISIEPPERRVAAACEAPEAARDEHSGRARRHAHGRTREGASSRMYAISLGDDGAELRPLEPWHAEEFLAHLDRGREFIGQYIPFGTNATDLDSARALLQRTPTSAPPTPGRLYGIWLDGKLVGGVLFLNFDAENGNCEVGCWLEPAGAGRGLVTRAMRVLIDWAVE